MSDNKITIIIPVLNDVDALKMLLPQLQACREQGHELLVIDGGSSDGSIPFSRNLVDRILMTGVGRGRQMNLGAENASHNILLFLHADSRISDQCLEELLAAMSESCNHWGRFDVQLDQPGFSYSVIAAMMNLRSRLSGVSTGDQGMFVRREIFHRVGGFQSISLMEDIALSKALRKHSRPVCLSSKLLTSARRWQQQGIVKTIFLMWSLRLAYFLGANPDKLAEIYYPAAAESSNGQADK
ncbi:MAG: rSAM/selenodomain-associated transferase 2 [Pseudohongiellaceae bacterium]|jgi:rSAM/selenodomain-associated transferase 2